MWEDEQKKERKKEKKNKRNKKKRTATLERITVHEDKRVISE